ncbi:MAG TPA: T9SS type A sorting domain-containing protein [Candidatus Cloacimonadota bacterium]|nr:T9SS type A sorting domain-containing protein [Candidatus Cloacimonadota bacterium]
MRLRTLLILSALLIGAVAAQASHIYVVNSSSRTLTLIDTQTGSLNNSFAQLGLTPNLMYLGDEHIWVACSGDNAVQMLDRSTGAHLRYIPVASSSNPYDVVQEGDYLYVSGLFTNKVYKISLQSYSVVASLDVGNSPQGLCVAQGKLFVCNTGGYANNYANSSISVIDLQSFSVIQTIPVWTNPQFAVARDGYLHVSCTGNWVNVAGKIDIIDLASLQRAQRIDMGGNPGSLWISPQDIAWVGDGMGNSLYSYDADSWELLHGAENPLNYQASMVSGTAEHLALLKQNYPEACVVRLYTSNLSLVATYTVGYSSSDILMVGEGQTAAEDELQALTPGLYPNPASSGSALHLSKQVRESGSFRLFNLRGQMVGNVHLEQGAESVQLPHLPAGVYLYRLQTAGKSLNGKLVIVK